jgi:hypothetical protein
LSYPTVRGRAVEGILFREAQSCLGARLANATYRFFISGTNTPANVYENGALTTPFPITGFVTADNFGRFPAIYLDPSVIYKVQCFNSANVGQWQLDPYTSQLATVGTSSLSAFGLTIAPTGEFVVPAPNTGGTGISLTLKAGTLGSAALQISSTVAGNSPLIVNSSATTGAQTATFAATNKPGTATSGPAGWLPITCDGVQYYTPIWHGNSFSPYVANPSANGETIVGSSVTFGGNGLTTVSAGTATPGNWFSPVSAGIGASYYINITKTSGLSGVNFSTAQGSWTLIGSGGGTIISNAQSPVSGTYQLSTSITGSPVAATGTITLQNNNGVQSPTYNGATPLALGGDGTASLNGGGTVAGNWYAPTTPNTGSAYYISLNQTGGSAGTSFTGVSSLTNITNSGIVIGITGGVGTTFATGSYTIYGDAGGTIALGSGTITLTGGTLVQSSNWSGTTPLVLNGDGSATLNGAGTSSWYSPNAANTGSSYWVNITRTGGTSGVNFTAAQGSWTNITNTGLTVDMSGYTGDVGTVTVTGTYQISSSVSGTPVLGSGSISLSVNAGTVTHSYPGPTSGTETVPTNASSVLIEGYGDGAGGSFNSSNQDGGGGAYAALTIAVSGGQTLTYSVGGGGLGATSTGLGANGAGTTVSGTVTGGTVSLSAGGGHGSGTGGAASGGSTNTAGGAGTTSASGAGAGPLGGASTANSSSTLPVAGNIYGGGGAISTSTFSPVTNTFTTAGAHPITIPSGCSSMTLEIEGGGGGGGGSSTTVQGNGASSGGRCVSTYAVTPSNWGQTVTLTCGAVKSSTGTPQNNGQAGNASTVVSGTFSITTMTANGGGGGQATLNGAGAGGSASGGNVTNQTGNTATTGSASGAAGLTGTLINGLAGASGAAHPGGVAQPDTATTLGQGAVTFTGGSTTAQNGAGGLVKFSYS